jgi:hypothetical protein
MGAELYRFLLHKFTSKLTFSHVLAQGNSDFRACGRIDLITCGCCKACKFLDISFIFLHDSFSNQESVSLYLYVSLFNLPRFALTFSQLALRKRSESLSVLHRSKLFIRDP